MMSRFNPINAAAFMCLLVVTQAAHSQAVAVGTMAELREITVDASSDLGPMKPLRGVNSGPLPWSDRPAVERLHDVVEVSDRTGYRSLGADASIGYRAANIELVRIHDNYGPGDVYANFTGTREMADGTFVPASAFNALVMFPKPDADPADAASYNFGPTDRLLHKLTGGRVIVSRLLVPSMVLTTTGRKSGLPRESPLACVPDGPGRWYVVGSNFGREAHPVTRGTEGL